MNSRRARKLRKLWGTGNAYRAAKRRVGRPAPAAVACLVTREMRRIDRMTHRLKDPSTPMTEKRSLLSYLRGRRNILFHSGASR